MSAISERIAQVRERRPVVDHVVRMVDHYGQAGASQQAGAVTYFAFLSFFPILALSVFVVGYVSHVYPDANKNLADAINMVLPNLVGSNPGQISMSDVRSFSGVAGIVGLLGVVYSGLGWISALRTALIAVFELPKWEQPNFVTGKLRDLLTLVVIGFVLIVAVAVTGFISGFSGTVLDWLGLGHQLGWLVQLFAVALGLAANTLLFLALFRLLAEPPVPMRSLLQGALLGAVGFEVLKKISGLLFKTTTGQPAFQAFGIALILVVWINYFSRVVLYAASWACTTPEARAALETADRQPVQGPQTPSMVDHPAVGGGAGGSWAAPFAAGGATALALVAVLRRRR